MKLGAIINVLYIYRVLIKLSHKIFESIWISRLLILVFISGLLRVNDFLMRCSFETHLFPYFFRPSLFFNFSLKNSFLNLLGVGTAAVADDEVILITDAGSMLAEERVEDGAEDGPVSRSPSV